MNASSVNAIQAVWLDPFSPLADTDRAQLDAAGISLQTVATLGDLHVALRRAHVLIIRLGDNAELLGEVQTLIGQLGHRVPVICRVERRRMEVAVDAMRLGALHVLPADEWNTRLWADAVSALQVNAQAPRSFVFVDPVSQQLLALAQRVAQTEVTALLVGPTGAGKEVLARVLHEASPRAKGPFVALNCAALPEHLIEDMLFGHDKGAFTGAHKEHKGLFEQAHGGTVFLDEIGEMPIHLQAKLLRVLQEKKLNRLGGEATIDLDVRLIAATNKDLRAAIDAREFREDLYFRISTFRLRIQPLRERQGDILPLVAQSLARHAKGGVPLSVELNRQGHTAFGVSRQRLRHQGKDVALALAQWLNAQPERADAKVQVFTELTRIDGSAQVFVGGGNEPHIQVNRCFTTQAVEFFLLQHAQQLGLQVDGHFANFVQKHGAAMGLFEQAFVLFVRAGECAFVMAKQHVFDQVLGQGRAIEGHKRAFGTGRRFVQHTGQYFFACTGGAHQQGGHFGLGHALGQGQQLLADRVHKHKAAWGLGIDLQS